MSGEFTLDIPADAQTLVFSFVGMKTQEIQIAGNSVFNVTMQEETIGLGEVVAVGYGIQKKIDITGAVGSVQSENFNRGVINSPGQLFRVKLQV
jgi:TonB-dependent starch-binding outer membrane protein SusC